MAEFVQVDDQRVPVVPMGTLDSDDNWSRRRILRSEQGKRSASVAAAEMLTSFALNPTSSGQRDAALRMLNDIDLPELEEAAPVTQPQIVLPAGVEEPPAEPEPVPEPEPESTDYELPAEVAELLEEPDEEEPEPEPYEPAAYDPDAYEDPQVAEMRRRAEAAERKADHERSLRVQTARKDWEAEARTVFKRLLDDGEIAGIQADSKRSFFKQAREIADRNKVIAQRFAPQPATPEPTAAAVDEEQIRADERERVLAQMWGRPPGGGTPVPDSSAQQDRLARARRNGNLKDIMKARIFPDG